MGMVVRTNMAALGANNSLAQASKAQQNGMQKLYTGFKINSAKDDASGLAITEKMKNQIKALDTAKDNCEDGANMIQTAEGYMKETHDILTRMTELSEKAANGLLKDEDRNALQNEMDQLCGEIDRMASTANFNGVKLMDGSLGSKSVVTISSDQDGNYKYNSPSKKPSYGGGTVVGAGDTYDAATKTYTVGNKSGNYKVSSIEAASTGGATVKANLLDEYGNASSTAVTFTLSPQVGDTVTIGTDKTGTTANGLKITEADEKAQGATFEYRQTGVDANDQATYDWVDISGKGVSMGSSAKFQATGTKGDVFSYDGMAALGDGTTANGIKLQIGDSSTSADRMSVSINSFHTDSLFGGLNGVKNMSLDKTDAANTAEVKIKTTNDSSTYKNAMSVDISDKDAASAAADAIRQISNYVSDERGKLGAQQNRLEHTVNNLTTASENTTAAKSRILDTDMAKEMMEYTSKNVIAQAAQSMLAQANSQPQNVLSLLQ